MESDTLCEQLALAMDAGPCCWCCTPCQLPGGGVSCCCASGRCTQPCCVPREHEFAGELWFQQQACDDSKPLRKMGLLEDPPGHLGNLEGSPRLGVLQDRGSANSSDTGGRVASCCSGKRKASRMGPGGVDGSEEQRPPHVEVRQPLSGNSIFEGNPLMAEEVEQAKVSEPLDAVLQALMHQKRPPQAEPYIAAPVLNGPPQKGFGAFLPETNYLLIPPGKGLGTKSPPPAPDGALHQSGAVAGHAGVAYPAPHKGGGKVVREIISNMRMPDSKAPANRFMYAQVFNGTTLAAAQMQTQPKPTQPKAGTSLAGILDNTPSRILRKAVATKDLSLGLSLLPPPKVANSPSYGVEKAPEQGGSDKQAALLGKFTPASIIAGAVELSQLSGEASADVKRKAHSSTSLARSTKRPKTTLLPSKLSDPSLNSKPVDGVLPSDSSSSSSDEVESSDYDPSAMYKCTAARPNVELCSLDLPLKPLPSTASSLGIVKVGELPFSPEASEARCCSHGEDGKAILGMQGVPMAPVKEEESGASSELALEEPEGRGGVQAEVEKLSVRQLFEHLRTAKVAEGQAKAEVIAKPEVSGGEASGLSLGPLSLLADTPDLLLKVLTSNLSARDLAAVECACRYFHAPASFAPDLTMTLPVVAAYRSSQAHPVYKSWPQSTQERLLKRCEGNWKVVLHHLRALDRAHSTNEGMVQVGPDFSCVVNPSGELHIFGGSKARFACLGERGMEHLWEQRRVAHELADKRISYVAAGPGSVVAVTSEGDVYAFGKNEQGFLGLPGQEDVVLPKLVTALSGTPIAQVACGTRVTCFLSREGHVYTCGASPVGGLGLGDTTSADTPVLVEALLDVRVVQISAGWDHFLAVSDKGEVYAWGEGGKGQLGQGRFANEAGDKGQFGEDAFKSEIVPKRVSRLSEHFGAFIAQAAAGPYHSVVLAADGRVFVWGTPPNGIRSRDVEEGDAVVQELKGMEGMRPVHVAAGALTTFVVGDLGEVYSFGCCFYGELGLEGWGLVTLEPRRVEVLRPHKIVQIAASWFRHTIARTSKGEIVVMGLNSSGQLGIPFTEAHAGVWKPRVISENALPSL